MKVIIDRIKSRTQPALQRASGWASQHAEKLSPARKKIVVIIFCILFMSLSICIALTTLSRSGVRTLPVMPIRVPSHIGKNIRMPSAFISEVSYQKVEQFKQYLDSISISDKKTFDQIIAARPGLIDSIAMFEKLYLSQSKKQ
jgi:hypothetical protein